MLLQIDKLGKVAVTIEKDYWNINKDYDKLTVVEVADKFATYISRIPVPAGTELNNRKYWIPFSSLKEEIVIHYNEWINLFGGLLTSQAEVLNNIQKIINDIYTHLPKGIIFEGDIDVYDVGESATIHLTCTTTGTKPASEIKLYKNNTLIETWHNVTGFEIDETVDNDTEFRVEAVIDGWKYYGSWNVAMVYPFYIGAGTDVENIIANEDYKHKGSEGLNGIYQVSPNDSDNIFIVAPKWVAIPEATMGGVKIPFDSATEYIIDEIVYYVYKSSNQYQQGHYSIKIGSVEYDKDSLTAELLNKVTDISDEFANYDDRISEVERISGNREESSVAPTHMGRVTLKSNVKYPITKGWGIYSYTFDYDGDYTVDVLIYFENDKFYLPYRNVRHPKVINVISQTSYGEQKLDVGDADVNDIATALNITEESQYLFYDDDDFVVTMPDDSKLSIADVIRNNWPLHDYTDFLDVKNLLTQSMINEPNTIYVIQYDFTLDGKELNVPEGCVLKFEGGSLSNGTLVGNGTGIEAGLVKIFDTNVTIDGTWNVAEVYPEWFGAKGDGVSDDTIAIQKTVDNFRDIVFSEKTYCVSNTILIKERKSTITGKSKYYSIIKAITDVEWIMRTVIIGDDGVVPQSSYYAIDMITVNNIYFDGNEKAQNGLMIWGPSSIIDNTYVIRCKEIGIQSFSWCNTISNCIVTTCKRGLYVGQNANSVSVFNNRLESCYIGLYVTGALNCYVFFNTIEGNDYTDIFAGYCQGLYIENNYFENPNCSIPEDNIVKTKNGTLSPINLGYDIHTHILINATASVSNPYKVILDTSNYQSSNISIKNNRFEESENSVRPSIVTATNAKNIIVEHNVSRHSGVALEIFCIENLTSSAIRVKDNILRGNISTTSKLKSLGFIALQDNISYNQWINIFEDNFEIDDNDIIYGDSVSNWTVLRTDSGRVPAHTISYFSSSDIIYSFKPTNNDNFFGIRQVVLPEGLYCFDFSIKSTGSSSIPLVIWCYRDITLIPFIKTIETTAEFKNIKIYIPIIPGIVDSFLVMFRASQSTEEYDIKNPIIYKCTLKKPNISYVNSMARGFQNDNTTTFLTIGMPIGTVGIGTDNKRYICTANKEVNTYYDKYELSGNNLRICGTTNQRNDIPTSDIYKGFRFYDTTIHKALVYTGSGRWLTEEGYSPVAENGTFANRPTNQLTATDEGFPYYCTDTHKVIYFSFGDGTTSNPKTWYYADGTEVTA